MKYQLSNEGAFPLVYVYLTSGEEVRIENGAMVYHNGQVQLEGKMNSNGSGGLGGALKALGRSAVGGESFFITTVKGLTENGFIAIAPSSIGQIKELEVGATQWRINDGSFLACDAAVNYSMKRQGIGKAMFGGTGGFFIMETQGVGKMLVSAYGDIQEIQLDGTTPLVVDNFHVVAWTATLDYNIRAASGMFGFTTGEGLVNEFHGAGTVLVQSRNVSGLASMVAPHIVKGK